MPQKVRCNIDVFGRELCLYRIEVFMEHFPLTPVEEDYRLHDPLLRENFIKRIFTCWRYREVMAEKNSGNLVEFHIRNKLLLMAHRPEHLKQMGHLVAHENSSRKRSLSRNMRSSSWRRCRSSHQRRSIPIVLHHIMGYFKKSISADEKRELLEVVDEYRKGLIPLIVPVTIMNHSVRKYKESYLKEQVYLNPHPLELQLRNHA